MTGTWSATSTQHAIPDENRFGCTWESTNCCAGASPQRIGAGQGQDGGQRRRTVGDRDRHRLLRKRCQSLGRIGLC